MSSPQAAIQQDWENREFIETLTAGIKRIAETLQNHDLPVVKPLAPAYRRKLTDGDAKAIIQPARKFAPEPEKSEFGFPTELRHDFARAARRPHTSAAESRSSCRT